MARQWIILIPAYEPEETLVDLLREIKTLGYEAVVVDDGSGKAYEDRMLRCAPLAHLLTHEVNRGKGRALKTGMAYIRSHYHGDYGIVTMDADGQHTISDMQKICAQADKHAGVLILGTRYLTGKVPPRSRLGNSLTRWVYRMTTGVSIYDTQTGLRAFDSRLVSEFMDIPGERYEYEMKVLLECAKRHIPMVEVPIETVYINDNASSHFNVLRDSFHIYKEIFRFCATSIAGFCVDYLFYSIFGFLLSGSGTAGLAAANVCARLISGSFNYAVNKCYVFKSEKNTAKTAVQYVALAAGILVGNTALLGFMTGKLGINKYAAKLFVEIFFFFISWTVQKFVIFRKKDGSRQKRLHKRTKEGRQWFAF